MKLNCLGSRRFRRSSPGRSGYTLLEVLFYVSLISLFSGSFVVVLRGAYQASHDTRAMVERAAQLHRFARDWVRDVHAARSSEAVLDPSGTQRLILQNDGENEIEYQPEVDRIRRVQRQGGEVIHRETYLMGEQVDVQWQREDARPLVEARVWRVTDDEGRILRRHIAARLAANWRYAGEAP
jgi:type II secretory pathway pseudopilin PulG